MARQRTMYTLVNKYKEGKEVVAYELQAEGAEGTKRVTVDQMAYFVGRGVVTGVTAQIYNGKLLYRGVGDSIGSKEATQLKTKTSKLAATKTADEVAAAAPAKRRGRPPKKTADAQGVKTTKKSTDYIDAAIQSGAISQLSEVQQLLARIRIAKNKISYIDHGLLDPSLFEAGNTAITDTIAFNNLRSTIFKEFDMNIYVPEISSDARLRITYPFNGLEVGGYVDICKKGDSVKIDYKAIHFGNNGGSKTFHLIKEHAQAIDYLNTINGNLSYARNK